METLFGQLDPAPPPAKAEGPFAAVALEHGIDRLLDYSIPLRLRNTLRVGQVVKVPLGRKNKTQRGYVIAIHPTTDYPKIKPLSGVDDDRVLVSPKMMELALWMSRYYVAQLGTVLDAIVPAAVKKKIGLGYSQMVRLAQPREKIQELLEQTKAPKRRSVFARLLQLEPDHSIELNRLAGEAGTRPPTIRKLVRLGLITIHPEPDLGSLVSDIRITGGEVERTLNEEQQKVFDQLQPRLAQGFSVNLLYGVTGSGKTEIYLHCIRQIIEAGKQAIVLVPEIALTPQTVARFRARFPNVAALHSGLTATERHRFWQQISTGKADVVVGGTIRDLRASMPKLGMIVVDEEHESAYKRDQAPRYNAQRCGDQARAVGERAGAVGQCDTPSLESYARVAPSLTPSPGTPGEGRGEGLRERRDRSSTPTDSNPHPTSPGVPGEERREGRREEQKQKPLLLNLPNRVRGLALPHVELIDMKQEARMRRGIHLLSQRLEPMRRATVDAMHQAILLLNRRGYSNFIYCASCQEAIKCKYCDTTMTYHRAAAAHALNATTAEGIHTGSMQCHYCPRRQSAAPRLARSATRSSASSASARNASKKNSPANSPTSISPASIPTRCGIEPRLRSPVESFRQRGRAGHARHADDRQGFGLSKRHARRRGQRRHCPLSPRFPRR